MRKAGATIRDVAARAELSVASVSRVFNGHANVHPDARQRVLAAAEALGYVPHAGARSLSMARTHAVGVVIPDLHGEFFSEIVRGMDREAGRRGYHLLLSNMHADAEQAAQAMRSMRGRVDGMIVMAPGLDPQTVEAVLPVGIPAVLIASPNAGTRSAVAIDNRAGVEAVVAHLVETGRRALVHVAGPEGNIDATERREAFVDALARHLPGTPPRIIQGSFFQEAGEGAAHELLASGEAFDAIVAANDMVALGALHVLREAGVDVPGRVAVAGFDDVPLARFLSLTTVQVGIDEIGGRAMTRLFDDIDGKASDMMIDMITPRLIVRATTGTATEPHA